MNVNIRMPGATLIQALINEVATNATNARNMSVGDIVTTMQTKGVTLSKRILATVFNGSMAASREAYYASINRPLPSPPPPPPPPAPTGVPVVIEEAPAVSKSEIIGISVAVPVTVGLLALAAVVFR